MEGFDDNPGEYNRGFPSSKRHNFVRKTTKITYQSSFVLVFLSYRDLVVSREAIYKGVTFMSTTSLMISSPNGVGKGSVRVTLLSHLKSTKNLNFLGSCF